MTVSVWEKSAAAVNGAMIRGAARDVTPCVITRALSLATPSHLPGQRLRILTFNVWGLPRPLLHRPSRMSEIAARSPGFAADVIAFQEVFSRRAYALAYLKGYPYRAWGEMKPGAGMMQGSGLLLLSRWPIVRTETHRFGCSSGVDRLARKGVLHARIRVPDIGEVDVFNTHLNAGLGRGKETIRERQMAELAGFIRHRAGRGPMVLTGDFNSEPGSSSYRVLTREFPMRDGHDEFQRVVLPLSGRNPPREVWEGFTLDPRRNVYSRATELFGRPMRIDHVWYRGGERHDFQLKDSRLVFDLPSPSGFLSDHFGVLADLEFRR